MALIPGSLPHLFGALITPDKSEEMMNTHFYTVTSFESSTNPVRAVFLHLSISIHGRRKWRRDR